MTRKTMLALLSILTIGITIPVYADVVVCSDTLILMQSPSGKQYCFTETSSIKLVDRGFVMVLTDGDSATHAVSDGIERIISKSIEPTVVTNKTQHIGVDFIHQMWPIYEFSIPKVITVGEEFMINVDYQYFVADDDGDIDNGVYTQLSQEAYEWVFDYGELLAIVYPPFVEIIDEKIDLVADDQTNTLWNPPLITSAGIYNNLEFNNTKELSLQIPMTINEPTTTYPGGAIAFTWATKDGPVFHFIVQGGRVIMSEGEPCQHPTYGVSWCHNKGIFQDLAGGVSDEIMQHRPVYIGDRWNATGEYKSQTDEERGRHLPRDPPLQEYGEFLLNAYPDANHMEMIKEFNFTSAFVDELFRTFPDLNKNSFQPIVNFVLPAAYGQYIPQSFVIGTVTGKNPDGTYFNTNNVMVCAFDKREFDRSEIDDPLEINGNPVCDETNHEGMFSFTIPMIDTEGRIGNTPDLFVKVMIGNEFIDVVKEDAMNSNSEILHRFNDITNVMNNISTTHIDYGNVDISVYQPTNDAAYVNDILVDAHRWYRNTVLHSPDKVTVHYSPTKCALGGVNAVLHNIYLDDNNIRTLPDGRFLTCGEDIPPTEAPDTIRHEYGHAIHFEVYGDKNSNLPDYDCYGQW